MMAAYGNEDYPQRAQECACDAYLTKPIDFTPHKEQIRAIADEAGA